jgi:uncharacterized protein (DUF2235 family)
MQLGRRDDCHGSTRSDRVGDFVTDSEDKNAQVHERPQARGYLYSSVQQPQNTKVFGLATMSSHEHHFHQHRWRPKSYPAQSCEHDSPDSHGLRNSSAPSDDRGSKLPASINAVQDSDAPPAGGRTLVICLDGTGDQFDSDNSNVVHFVSCLKKDHPSQVTYYQSGIGTYDGHGLKSGVAAGIDMAVGSGLGVHIKDAYRFLMETYREGDRICLFGFSRGAYTVRCLAGMLHKVGLLPAHNRAQVSFAYKFYKDDTEEGWLMSTDFKKTFCIDVEVYFVGVWDCVASVGFIPRKLPFSSTPTNSTHFFRHAMALDEHRAKFKICQWQQQDPDAEPDTIDNTPQAKVKTATQKLLGQTRRLVNSCFGSEATKEEDEVTSNKRSSTSSASSMTLAEQYIEEDKQKKLEEMKKTGKGHNPTNYLEVWFAGAHADVGGGAVKNEVRHMLSRIPLRWMIRQCFDCNTGIIFRTGALAEVGIDVPTVWPSYQAPNKPIVGPSPNMVEQYTSCALLPITRRSTTLELDEEKEKNLGSGEKKGMEDAREEQARRRLQAGLLPEQAEDYFDAIARINDQLVDAKGWWLLEFWPIKLRVQKEPGLWVKVLRMNMGRYRAIREEEPKMHWTVETRMMEQKYRVRNPVDNNTIWQVAI